MNPLGERRNSIPLIIFSVALAIKIVIFFFITDPIVFIKYPYFGERIAKGIDIGERILDLSPFYLYFTALFYKLSGPDWEALALLQILLGSFNCVIVYLIGEKVFNRATGVIGALMLLLYGNMTLIELTLEPETFVLLFNTLSLWALLQAGDNANASRYPWRWLEAGLLIGLSVITKANTILILPGALIWIVLCLKTRRSRMAAAAALLLGTALLVAPVTLRNALMFNDFIPITADGGKVFFHGNGPGATGMERADLPQQGFIEEGYQEPDYAHALFRKTARTISKQNLSPAECSSFWFSRTWEHMVGNPLSALVLAVKKFSYFWNNYEVHDLDSTYKNYVALQSWPFLPFGIISAFGILGMAISIKRFRPAFLLYWLVLIYLLVVIVFFAASRYRIPAAPVMCLFAARFIREVYFYVRRKRFSRVIMLLIPIPLVTAATYLPFKAETDHFDRWQQASRIHYSLGGKTLFSKHHYKDAIGEFQIVIAIDPTFVPAHNYLGKSYAILGDYGKAEKSFQEVIRHAPAVPEGYLNMGLLKELTGKPSEAIPYFEKVISLDPRNKKARQHLENVVRAAPG